MTDTFESYIQLLSCIVIFTPLFSGLLIALYQKHLKWNYIITISCTNIGLSSIAAWYIFLQKVLIDTPLKTIKYKIISWIYIPGFNVDFSIRIDSLSSFMMIIITSISLAVHIYSIDYIAHDQGKKRFISYLSLFTFFMLLLIASDNFLQLFLGWEGVGLCSYLLIGFWHNHTIATAAATKSFIVNRIGDLGLIIAICFLFAQYNTLDFDDVFAIQSSHTINIAICSLLFWACIAKSAQLGLHIWLPDAMEGPTPASALIHAATMVTAGIFLMARCSPLFTQVLVVQNVIIIIGGITALISATIAIVQTDIKKIIAYSTCSQLGYMVLACGLSAYSAAMFHLFTHAFFKALLFLAAGSIITALHNQQDITKMGDLRNKLPITYIMTVIASLALMGIFPFGGFYSKDAILEAAYIRIADIGIYPYYLGIITSGLTGVYSAKLLFFTFHNTRQWSYKKYPHIKEAPPLMLYSMSVLAIFTIFSGFIAEHYWHIISLDEQKFWGNSISIQEASMFLYQSSFYTKLLPSIISISMFVSSIWFYFLSMKVNKKSTTRNKILDLLLLLPRNKYFFDQIYKRIFVNSMKKIGKFLNHSIELGSIDMVPRGLSYMVQYYANKLSKIHNGLIVNYVDLMLCATAIILCITIITLL